ncbi:MAG: ABC transporter permease [Acidobacteriota bacterium]
MDTLFQDLRYTVRGLRKSPGFTAVAAITLALGIGVNTTIFSVVNSALLRPLAVENPGDLVDVYSQSTKSRDSHDSSSYLDYRDLRDQSHTLSGLFGYTNFIGNHVQEGRNEIVVGELVTEGYFETLGVQPALGRTFSAEELATEGTHPVVMLSDSFWKTRYGGDPEILGRQIRLSGILYTVVGVAPEGFGGMFPAVTAPMWVPVTMVEALEPLGNLSSVASPTGNTRLTRRGSRFLWMRGRLREGVSVEEARAELVGIMARLEQQYPPTNEFVSVAVLATDEVRFNPDFDGFLAPAGALILGVVGLVLLVACANIANLLLARASSRRKEVAIRLAVGAGRGRLVRQLLTESLLLAAFGAGLGLLLGVWLTSVIANIRIPLPIEPSLDFRLDIRVLAFVTAATLATGILFGLVPALRASRPDLVPALKDISGEGRGRCRFALRDALVVVQVAVSIVLLIGGALLVRSLVIAQRIDVGFDVDRIAMLALGLEAVGYEQEAGETLLDTAKLRLRSIPGVEAVSMSSRVPLSVNDNRFRVYIDGHQTSNAEPAYLVGGTHADPDYFDSLEVSIVEGRNFVAADAEEERRVAIINEAMAARYWPGESAVGRTFRRTFGGEPIEIIGVVQNYKVDTPGEPPTPYIHMPFTHNSSLYAAYLVRMDTPVAAHIPRLEQVFFDLDPAIAFMQTAPLRDNMNVRLLPVKLGAWFIGAFAMLALTLAAVGLYGVISYSVSRRRREIGIRVALGAGSGKVLWLVVWQGMTLVLIGAVIGAVVAAFVGQLLSSVLYGISAIDPVAFAGAIGILTLLSLVANYIPARRASRVDPMIALRSE